MPGNDVADISSSLELSAELALGFLAFSAVIITLADQRIRDGRAKDIAAGLLHVPTILLIASVAPLIVGYAHVLESSDWRIASAVLLLIWVVDYAIGIRERRWQETRSLTLEVSFVIVICFVPILANVGSFYPSASFGYAVGIGALLLASAIIFMQLVRALTAHADRVDQHNPRNSA